MPLVFVHGVNVRHGELYDRELAFRDKHFLEILYKQLGRNVKIDSIFNPYWGDLGASLSADAPFLPRGGYDMLWRKHSQAESDAESEVLERGIEYAAGEAQSDADFDAEADVIGDVINSDSPTPLLEMARTASLPDVVDLLLEIIDQEMAETGGQYNQTADDIAKLAQRALDFRHSPEGESWLKGLKSDDELIERLSTLVISSSSSAQANSSGQKGNADLIRSAGTRLRKRITDARQKLRTRSKSLKIRLQEDVSSARLRIRQKTVSATARLVNEPLRAIFHQQCALLIGDAFAYFSARGENEAAPIAERVIASLEQAAAMKQKTGDELIVIGHSMGGVILCDIVTRYGKHIPIDVLITVGSQFPLFADLQMFPGINGVPRPIPRPANVKHWINIFDPHDFLGYPASHIFSGVDDFHLPTYALGASTHTNYFNRRSFYFQLARRLADYLPAKAKQTAP